jgi:hypothetical protein
MKRTKSLEIMQAYDTYWLLVIGTLVEPYVDTDAQRVREGPLIAMILAQSTTSLCSMRGGDYCQK